MTTIRINGVTLSANATLNGFPLRLGRPLAPIKPFRHPDSQKSPRRRQRRSERLFVRSVKLALVEALS